VLKQHSDAEENEKFVIKTTISNKTAQAFREKDKNAENVLKYNKKAGRD